MHSKEKQNDTPNNIKSRKKQSVIALICAAVAVVGLALIMKFFGSASGGSETEPPEKLVLINELSANSQKAVFDEDGDYSDFIELYNNTESPINLSGWSITDNSEKVSKYLFGDITIEPGKCLLLFASGKDKQEEGMIHLNFKLSAGETLTLYSSTSVVMDRVVVPEMDENSSYGRNGLSDIDTWGYFVSPTPGIQNMTRFFTTPEDAQGKLGSYLYISEAIPAPSSGEDWIELYNASDTDISLDGYEISDSFKYAKYHFPSDTLIKAKSFLRLYADGKNTVSEAGYIHTNFKLEKLNESVVLSYNGVALNCVEYGYMKTGVSVGYSDPDDNKRYYYTTPTPSAANSDTRYTGYSPQVFFTEASGQYKDSVTVELYCEQHGAQIYYTTNGSSPNSTSKLYNEPLVIKKNTPIRAIAYKEGTITSTASTANYIINTDHTLPIMFITTKSSNLFNGGIYNSVYSDRRRVGANLTLVETDGTLGFSIQAYISKHGNMSVFEPQKSFSVNLSERLGESSLKYKLFPDDDKKATEFGSFILRTSGNDWDDTKVKDGMLQTLAATQMDLDYQGYRPCVLYINGKYWGIYNIREKQNEDYLNYYYGVDKNKVDIISFGHGVHSGSYTQYNKLINFIKNNNLDKAENWEKLNGMMDVENMIDTYLCHIYYSNFDTVNIKWWRERKDGARWRWFIYDLDYALYVPTQNNLRLITNPSGHGVNNYFSSVLIYNLMKSDKFQDLFLTRLSSYWPTIFNADNILNYYYKCLKAIAPEMMDQIKRWDISKSHYLAEMDECYDFIKRRPALFRTMVKNYFNLSTAKLNKLLPAQKVTVKKLNWWKEIS